MKNLTMLKKSLFMALGLGVLGAGCGQVSFVEMTASVTGTRADCAYAINTCEVTVSGAASDKFNLSSAACSAPMSLQLGVFQYGTDAESGTLNFQLDIFDGNLKKLGTGTGSATIKAGGRAMGTVVATADTAAFTATGSCPP